MTHPTAEQRASFERWATPLGFALERGDASGRYLSEYSNDAWEAWQGACEWMRVSTKDHERLGIELLVALKELVKMETEIWADDYYAIVMSSARAVIAKAEAA